MQILPTTATPVSSLPGKPTGPDASVKGSPDEFGTRRTDQPVSEPVPIESPSTDSVSISSAANSYQPANTPTPVYAEIWKGSIKIAQIDMRGQVHSFSGLLAASGDVGIAGPMLAAQRAVQLAQQVGGEIRTAGQTIDNRSLLMRARLIESYQTNLQAK
jgi:hypothetical protein